MDQRGALGELLGGRADRVAELGVVVGGGHGRIHPAEENGRGHRHEAGEQAEGDDEGDEPDARARPCPGRPAARRR